MLLSKLLPHLCDEVARQGARDTKPFHNAAAGWAGLTTMTSMAQDCSSLAGSRRTPQLSHEIHWKRSISDWTYRHLFPQQVWPDSESRLVHLNTLNSAPCTQLGAWQSPQGRQGRHKMKHDFPSAANAFVTEPLGLHRLTLPCVVLLHEKPMSVIAELCSDRREL